MYKEHPSFEMPSDNNAVIWRYLNFTKLVSLLDTKMLFFARASAMSDTFEGSVSRANRDLRPILYEGIPLEGYVAISSLHEGMRRFAYLNCWHMNSCESAAMWQLYTDSNHGVAIRSTFRKLADSFHSHLLDDVYIGKVKYVDYQTELIPEGNVFNPFVHKRRSFEHEREIRAIIARFPIEGDMLHLNEEPDEKGAMIPVDLDILVDAIFVAPLAEPWFKDLVASVTRKYGMGKDVIQSSLADDPIY